LPTRLQQPRSQSLPALDSHRHQAAIAPCLPSLAPSRSRQVLQPRPRQRYWSPSQRSQTKRPPPRWRSAGMMTVWRQGTWGQTGEARPTAAKGLRRGRKKTRRGRTARQRRPTSLGIEIGLWLDGLLPARWERGAASADQTIFTARVGRLPKSLTGEDEDFELPPPAPLVVLLLPVLALELVLASRSTRQFSSSRVRKPCFPPLRPCPCAWPWPW
jgi:hypothetical protein